MRFRCRLRNIIQRQACISALFSQLSVKLLLSLEEICNLFLSETFCFWLFLTCISLVSSCSIFWCEKCTIILITGLCFWRSFMNLWLISLSFGRFKLLIFFKYYFCIIFTPFLILDILLFLLSLYTISFHIFFS